MCTAGTVLVRGHDPAKAPDWFGPPLNSSGKHRFDVPFRDADCNVGTCYLAERLDGVLLERVLRGISRAVLTISTLHGKHAITLATTKRALVLIDLVHTLSTVHGLEAEDIVAQPPYGKTQAMARQWAQASHPTPVDGILYSSRFGSGALCLALWNSAAGAISWGAPAPLDADLQALSDACDRLGLGLLP